jgi:hypothetical protein
VKWAVIILAPVMRVDSGLSELLKSPVHLTNVYLCTGSGTARTMTTDPIGCQRASGDSSMLPAPDGVTSVVTANSVMKSAVCTESAWTEMSWDMFPPSLHNRN